MQFQLMISEIFGKLNQIMQFQLEFMMYKITYGCISRYECCCKNILHLHFNLKTQKF